MKQGAKSKVLIALASALAGGGIGAHFTARSFRQTMAAEVDARTTAEAQKFLMQYDG